jgi:transglutaminase-like putative cysteine protease
LSAGTARHESGLTPHLGARPTLDLAVRLLVLDGLFALYLGEFIGVAVAVLCGVAVLASGWFARRRLRLDGRARLLRAAPPLAAAASIVDVLYLAETALDGLVRLLLFLVLYKLATLHSLRDTRTVAFLAFFMLVASSASAFDVAFLFIFVAFVVLATWVLLLQEVLAGAEAAPRRIQVGAGPGPGHGRALFGLALLASAGAALITGGLFFIIPRIGLAALPLRASVGPLVTGFTDRVELGAYGQIETDRTVVMRVHVPDGLPDAHRLPNLRWRGIVFDTFDGRAWTAGRPARRVLARSAAGDFWVDAPRGTGPVITQQIFLEPIGTDVVFAAPRAVRFRMRAPAIEVDDMGSVSVRVPMARLSYLVDSELPLLADRGRVGRVPAPPLDPEAAARFLQLPPLTPRIGDLARRVAAGSREPYEIAQRLTRYLSSEFQYTLRLERQTALDPLEEFLFVRRAGNCEYFAAALAVMLRSLGVPARVVGGFQRGEWNPYGRYFMVRLADAHSWVEAYAEGPGWMTLDPSPRASADALASGGTVRLYLDALRLSWYRYVINWSIRDQLEVAMTIRRETLGLRAWLSAAQGLVDWADWRVAASLIAGALGVAGAVRLWRGGGAPWPRTARTLRFYERALAALGRRGLVPASGETAREFQARVAQRLPAAAEPLTRLTAAYERCRFGGAGLTARDQAEIEACLVTLSGRGR